jgi:hypothetical protein
MNKDVAATPIPLAAIVRDRVSGLEGLVIARTEWLYGCVRISIQPYGAHDGKPIESFTIDEPQCVLVREDEERFVEARHGPKPEAMRAKDPTR